MNIHPAAQTFPMMTPDELAALAADIRAYGLHQPIVLVGDAILDGRNRYQACQIAGVAPRFVQFAGDDPWAYVWSENAERRHLRPDQRAACWLVWGQGRESWLAAQRQVAREANEKRSEAIAGMPYAPKGEKRTREGALSRDNAPSQDGRTHLMVAKEASVSSATAARVQSLANSRPDLLQRVADGAISAVQALQLKKREDIARKLREVEDTAISPAQGPFDVIVLDPPWPMTKIERDERPNQVLLDYPVMTEAELAQLGLPCADDCHVWVWTTHKFLPMALRLLEVWRLTYVCTFVWHKPGGFQPYNLPQFNCEFALYAHRGNPVFVDTKAFNTCFDAPRGRHSEKPAEFYDLIRRVTAGRRLDMFSRRQIEGFVAWGKEAPHA